MNITAAEAKSTHSKIRRGRFEFLDVARGIAALSVLIQHAAESVFPSLKSFSEQVYNFGMFGVVLFFYGEWFYYSDQHGKGGLP